jgi:exopolyphosphatase / guanosine-5'-triphosphate,3'-diphosphate pyrophosphatase
MMMRIAAIDCGTNATRLLVSDVDGDDVREVTRRLVITRMGADLDALGFIGAAALDRVATALLGYAEICASLGVDRIAALATSAARDAGNVPDFVRMVRRILGIDPVVLTGDEEAEATYRGAVAGMSLVAPALVVDLGGGSAEFAMHVGGALQTASLQIGSVRLTERFFRSSQRTAEEVREAGIVIDRALGSLNTALPITDAHSVLAVGGTALTLAALHLELFDPDDLRLHGAEVPADVLRQLAEHLVYSPVEEVADLPPVTPGREDVIGAGALILATVVTRVGADSMTVGRHDLLDDLARRTAAAAA